MSQEATSNTPNLDHFLVHGLTKKVPSDLEETCGICVLSWQEDNTAITSLPCDHVFHRGCIEPWLIEGIEKIATCPICRRKLCIRPDSEVVSYSLSIDQPYEEVHWEGMSASRDSVSRLIPTIQEAVDEMWQWLTEEPNSMAWASLLTEQAIIYEEPEEISGDDEEVAQPSRQENVVEEREADWTVPTANEWSFLIIEAMRRFKSKDRTGLAQPCSCMEFLVVEIIMMLLWVKTKHFRLDSSALETMIDTILDYEEHSDARSIAEAFRAVGLDALVPETWGARLRALMLSLTMW